MNTQNQTDKFDDLFYDWMMTSVKIFPDQTADECLIKSKHESDEAIKAVKQDETVEEILEEMVDFCMTILSAYKRKQDKLPQDQRKKMTFEMFKEAFRMKLEKNKNRTWIRNEDGTYSHVKNAELFK